MSHSDVTFRWTDTDPAHPAKDVLIRLVALTGQAYDDGDLSGYLMEPDGAVSSGGRPPDPRRWSRTLSLPGDLRTAYQICPVRDRPLRGEHPDDERWMEILATGVPDPAAPDALPPGSVWGNPGAAVSILELPDALAQPWAARRPGVAPGTLRRVELGKSVVRVWTPPGVDPDVLPVVISFDGASLVRIGIDTTFANLVADAAVPPFVGVLVESINGSAERGPTRIRSLTHPGEFADFVLGELLPHLGNPREVVLAGQSLGGLAAGYLGSVAPERIGWVISQSAALWWPGDDDGGLSGDAVIAAYQDDRVPPVRFFLEAGSFEGELLESNRTFRDVLVKSGYDVSFREYRGGHDYSCWRGGLADGIVAALSTTVREAPVPDRTNR